MRMLRKRDGGPEAGWDAALCTMRVGELSTFVFGGETIKEVAHPQHAFTKSSCMRSRPLKTFRPVTHGTWDGHGGTTPPF